MEFQEIVLQERRTLDDVIKGAVRTFRNGCNLRLFYISKEEYYLEGGCYHLSIFATDDELLLWKWLQSPGNKNLYGITRPETLVWLMKQDPCRCCGGARFKKQEEENKPKRKYPWLGMSKESAPGRRWYGVFVSKDKGFTFGVTPDSGFTKNEVHGESGCILEDNFYYMLEDDYWENFKEER